MSPITQSREANHATFALRVTAKDGTGLCGQSQPARTRLSDFSEASPSIDAASAGRADIRLLVNGQASLSACCGSSCRNSTNRRSFKIIYEANLCSMPYQADLVEVKNEVRTRY